MSTSDDSFSDVELELDVSEVRPPTTRLLEFALASGDKVLSEGMKSGEFERQLRVAVEHLA